MLLEVGSHWLCVKEKKKVSVAAFLFLFCFKDLSILSFTLSLPNATFLFFLPVLRSIDFSILLLY